ncbi:hypothetical protein C8Q80DRAFT_1207471 [Daedaleopsis nitida]|nr:hypothetical protein C8Q80DRAFT_1207471 [Daedaleopsis nitida]
MLYKLPTELLTEILKLLDAKTILRCTLVCRRLWTVIRDSIELQYLVELDADGLVDGIDCTLTTSQRLERVLQRRARWRNLEWDRRVSIPAPTHYQAYELVDGVFASSRILLFAGSRHLALTWLPTLATAGKSMEREDIGFVIRDFAIDPSQDLLALVLKDSAPMFHLPPRFFTIHLQTISGNKPHPLAAQPVLNLGLPGSATNAFTQIVDDVIGAFFWMEGPCLCIWNWRTGKQVVNCKTTELPRGVCDFAFISSRAFIVMVAGEAGSIQVFTFNGDEDAASEPVESHPLPWTVRYRSPVKVAHLVFPFPEPPYTLIRAFTHSGPFVARPTPGRPFQTSRDTHVHMISLDYDLANFSMFVHNRFFLSLLSIACDPQEPSVPATEWEQWGPENTRLMDSVGDPAWLRYVHGGRVVTPPRRQGLPCVLVSVLDFNVHPKRRNDPVPMPSEDIYRLIESEDVIEPGVPFQERVVTRLPYAESTRTFSSVYSGFMIDDERLIGLQVVALILCHCLTSN